MKLKNGVVLLGIAWVLSVSANASENHGHEHGHKPMHGGIVAEAGEINFELVAKADALTIHVTDHGKPVPSAGAKASGTVFAGGEKVPVTFSPAGENLLVAKGSFKPGVGVRVAVSVSLAGKPEQKLMFRLK